MKRMIAFVLVAFLVFMGMPLATAAGISASLTGPRTVRSGDTITLKLQISGTNILVVQGTILFDTSKLEYKGNGGTLSGWKVDINQSSGKLTFLAEDDNQTAPINGSKQLFTISFSVKAKVGAKITVSTSGVVATDGNSDFNAGNTSYSVTVAAPPSGNNKLKSLQVKNATISPAFNPDTTTYSANVPFDVAKLGVTATAADAKASVKINNPSLVPNATTNVVITVTAENGSKKTYTIKVKRARDPNYVESANNNLASLTVENAELSPAFQADVTAYTVNVPFEVEKLSVKAEAADPLATVDISDPTLQEGTTDVIITVTAENGSKKIYTIKASRASYVPGSNNALSNIVLDKSMLSPPFRPDITRYIVWLPYEVDSLNVTGVPADPKAKVEVQGGSNLEPGKDNEIKIICTSENGEAKEYLIVARRALPEGEAVNNPSREDKRNLPASVPTWALILTAVVCAAAGFESGVLMLRKKR